MPALNFNPRFLPFILDNTKPHTIRRVRKHSIAVGQDLRLYTGLRTKNPLMLRDWTPCLGVQDVCITFGEGIWIDNVKLEPEQALSFMWRDGFRRGQALDQPDPEGFWHWFCKGLELGQSFHGVLISWAPHALLGEGKKA